MITYNQTINYDKFATCYQHKLRVVIRVSYIINIYFETKCQKCPKGPTVFVPDFITRACNSQTDLLHPTWPKGLTHGFWFQSHMDIHRWINLQPLYVLTVHVQHKFNSNANTYLNGSISWNIKSWLRGFLYVPPEFFSYLMSHICCMATTFPTDATRIWLGLQNQNPWIKPFGHAGWNTVYQSCGWTCPTGVWGPP